MRILIVGAGALGGFYGAMLARAGNEVTVLARGAALEALRANGLTIKSARFGSFAQPVTAIADPGEAGEIDLIFFAVKAYDLDTAARQVAPLVHDGVTLLAVQNGIEHPWQLAEYVGETAVLPGVVYVSTTVTAPGVIAHVGGPGLLQLGDAFAPNSERLAAVAELFRDAGLPVEAYPDLWPMLWRKFAAICAMSGVASITRLTLAQMFAVPETRQLYRDTMDEVVRVAIARGVDLPASTADELMGMLEAMPALPERGSMAYDLLAGRRLEIETLNGSAAPRGEGRRNVLMFHDMSSRTRAPTGRRPYPVGTAVG
jgi:2-dehydropantoate 2-reductase